MLENFRKKIEEHLETLIPKNSPFFSSLYLGGRHALLAPGKRIRPLLTLSVVAMLNEKEVEEPGPKGLQDSSSVKDFETELHGSPNPVLKNRDCGLASVQAALAPASALELIHTYSLIHDDLPCMDDDDFRRGQPTLHRIYTEGHAVLIGDYLLTYAFQIIAEAPLLSAAQKVSLIQCLCAASSAEGMIGGQIMDIEESPYVEQMHIQKTAALFRAAVLFGGIIAQVPDNILKILSLFGMQFGQLFQMVDDLLDADHPLGQEKAEEAADALFHMTLETLHSLPGDHSSLKIVTEEVFRQSKLALKNG